MSPKPKVIGAISTLDGAQHPFCIISVLDLEAYKIDGLGRMRVGDLGEGSLSHPPLNRTY
jgi:hypothetical protein